jgi:magnesium chelatase family protein
MGKLVGPLLDRVDLQLQVQPVSRAGLAAPVGETSAEVAARVAIARDLQVERLAGTTWRLNGEVPGPMMRAGFLKLPAAATVDLERALERGILTLRGYDRVLKVAWTVTDLAGGGTPSRDDVGLALTLRTQAAVAA